MLNNFWLKVFTLGSISGLFALPAWAETNLNSASDVSVFTKPKRDIPHLSDIKNFHNSTNVLVQTPTTNSAPVKDVVSITAVKANPIDKGVEVILQTTQGNQLQVTNRSTGNNFIADISGGQLRLPSGEAFTFRSEKPLAGITEINVINIDANTVRVTVVGEKALPAVELFDDDNVGLVFGITSHTTATQPEETPTAQEKPATETPQEKPSAQQDDAIELVVTGEQDGYRVPNASTATRTDTPLRDIPQSIQVIPRQVLEDRNVKTVGEAVETVSGVVETLSYLGGSSPVYTSRSIRGFQQDFSNFRNGFRDQGGAQLSLIGTTEQVEVLKGPASVLFGAIEPGGVINLITRQPLAEPYYKIQFEAGSFGQYQPSIDFSGPLTTDKSVLYRFIAAYRGGGNFQDTTRAETTTIAPSLTFKLGERTTLNLYYEYGRYYADPTSYVVPLLSNGRLPPKDFYSTYFALMDSESHRLGYTLNHELNQDWQIRNHFATRFSNYFYREIFYTGLLDERFLTGYGFGIYDNPISSYFGQIDLVGKFKTGSISHQLVAGFDFTRSVSYTGNIFSLTSNLPDLDIFNPNYDVPKPDFPSPAFNNLEIDQFYGVYFQDQITFSDNLKMLIGGRYDWLSSSGFRPINSDDPYQNDGAFSPRVGIVYQPSKNVSLYTSYSQSFRPSIGRNPDNKPFEPTRGTQYEVGVKADFLDGRLSTTLAAYNLTRTNVLTPNPDPILAQQGFQVQVGEQRSRGIELDVSGEILPGWKIIASYALTDAEVTADNSTPSIVGNRLGGVPQNQASLWTTYEIQKGNLQGLGFGLGLFYVGERQGDLGNSFQVGDYLRTDAAIYYRRGGFNTAINIRNLFDIDYVSSPGFGALYVNRGQPLTITGSISWEF